MQLYLPRKWSKLVFLASEWVSAFSNIYSELFPASPGVQLQELHRQRVFDPTGSNTITIVHRIEKNVFVDPIGGCNRIWPSWIEKVLTVISCKWAPGEAGNSSVWTDLGENPKSFRGEADQFPTFSGQKLVRTYWKGTSSTDCKSSCIRIGPTRIPDIMHCSCDSVCVHVPGHQVTPSTINYLVLITDIASTSSNSSL